MTKIQEEDIHGIFLHQFQIIVLEMNQNMTLLWPKHGPHMVLKIGSSWILINVPRDAPCQISQFLVYPIVHFP